jgi:sulfite reductase (ferredoxin)
VHLGGTIGEGASFGRKVRGVKIYAEDAADYVELLLRRYTQERAADATFSSFVNSLDDDALARFAEPAATHGELR